MLAKRNIVNTRYMDDHVLNALGLRDYIFWMLEQVGWTTLINFKFLTYEFLSSIEANILYVEGCDEGRITFCLFNAKHHLNLE